MFIEVVEFVMFQQTDQILQNGNGLDVQLRGGRHNFRKNRVSYRNVTADERFSS